jgi:DNA-directed RNA polymerase subunit omega
MRHENLLFLCPIMATANRIPAVLCGNSGTLSYTLHDLRKMVYYQIMIFPLEELIEYDKNMYEITAASSRRSYQLSMIKDPEVEENDGKMVSVAARQVFTKAIEFRLDTE